MQSVNKSSETFSTFKVSLRFVESPVMLQVSPEMV